MSDFLSKPSTAFAGVRRIAQGPLVDVALAVKAAGTSEAPLLVFDDTTGDVIDLDLRGATADIVSRLADRAREMQTAKRHRTGAPEVQTQQGRGRPKLGVVAREVTLLPRHWEWLAAQPGGASQTLRRLVEQVRRGDGGASRIRAAREAAYRFMSAMAGDLPGFEEAARALFAGDAKRFAEYVSDWPDDVRTYARKLAFDAAKDSADDRLS